MEKRKRSGAIRGDSMRRTMKGGRARKSTGGGGSSNNGKGTMATGETRGDRGKGGEETEGGAAKRQKAGASSSIAAAPNFAGHKLCGFVQAVLIARRCGVGGGDDDRRDEGAMAENEGGAGEEEKFVVPIGSPCHLARQGAETVAEVGNTGVILFSIPPAVSKFPPVSNAGEGAEDGKGEAARNEWMMMDGIGKLANNINGVSCTPDRNSLDSCVTSELMECTPVAERVASGNLCVDSAGGSTGGEKSRGGRKAGGGSAGPGSAAAKRTQNRSGASGLRVGSILQQLQLLEQRNNAIVTGRVVHMSRGDAAGGGTVRYVALLDVYLPSSLWSSTRNFWRNGSLVAMALSHLRSVLIYLSHSRTPYSLPTYFTTSRPRRSASLTIPILRTFLKKPVRDDFQ